MAFKKFGNEVHTSHSKRAELVASVHAKTVRLTAIDDQLAALRSYGLNLDNANGIQRLVAEQTQLKDDVAALETKINALDSTIAGALKHEERMTRAMDKVAPGADVKAADAVHAEIAAEEAEAAAKAKADTEAAAKAKAA